MEIREEWIVLLFPLPQGQLEQNYIGCKCFSNCLQNQNEIGGVTTGSQWLSFFVLGIKVQPLTNFYISTEIKLKFGERSIMRH